MKTLRRAFEVRFAADDAAPGSFSGYGNAYGVVDSYDSVFMPGVFAKSLAEHRAAGTSALMLWRHMPILQIGDWLEVREDAQGLFVRGALNLTKRMAARAHDLLMAGELNGLSVGFNARRETRLADGTRAILEAELVEISLVPRPSNPRARVISVRTAAAGTADLAAIIRRAAAQIGGR